jgi:leucyl aminopeptidase
MMSAVTVAGAAYSLRFVTTADLALISRQSESITAAWCRAMNYTAERGAILVLPDAARGGVSEVWVGLGTGAVDFLLAAALPDRLPPGEAMLDPSLPVETAMTVALGFAVGSYRYTRYKAVAPPAAQLRLPAGIDETTIAAVAQADALARDLINTPAQDMGPSMLAAAVEALARERGAEVEIISDVTRLAAEFPAVLAVGRSGAESPRVVILRSGEPEWPLVALVGKGVCFDTGGLDLKPSSGMALMKKDMGGAAVALAVAALVLRLRLRVRLLLVIPAVENGIGPNAFRPGDVLATRAGLTVEVTNTDAEGRLVLADALTYAGEADPELMIDFATLTGAARVALGPDLPALYGNDSVWVRAAADAAEAVADPLWPMPLWDGYEDELVSKVADLQNASSSGFAGSVTAALFLRRFAPVKRPWLHLDLYAWSPRDRPGRPSGASAQTVRAIYELLRRRYGGAGVPHAPVAQAER